MKRKRATPEVVLTLFRKYGDHTATVSRDDRGRIVAELWHTKSGKTIGITEVDTIQDGWWWWAKRLADTFQEN